MAFRNLQLGHLREGEDLLCLASETHWVQEAGERSYSPRNKEEPADQGGSSVCNAPPSLSADTWPLTFTKGRSLQSPRLCGSVFRVEPPLNWDEVVGQPRWGGGAVLGKALPDKHPKGGASAPGVMGS